MDGKLSSSRAYLLEMLTRRGVNADPQGPSRVPSSPRAHGTMLRSRSILNPQTTETRPTPKRIVA
jgi:hypothetical protein